MEVSGPFHALAALSPQKKKTAGNHLNRRLGGPQDWSGRLEKRKILPLPEVELRTFRFIA